MTKPFFRISRQGMTRTVILIGSWAIKFPTLRYGDRMFVIGMMANINERNFWRIEHHPALAPVLFCCPFGLFSIQTRCQEKPRDLSHHEMKWFFESTPLMNADMKNDNIMQLGEWFVVVDYGHPGADYVVEPDESWFET